MKRILITGKNSYVGTSVRKYLERWPKKYKVDEIDVKGDEWKNNDFSIYDVVFHVAGLAHRKINKSDKCQKELYIKINTDLAVDVAKQCKKAGIKQFIFMSTASVYGDGAKIGRRRIIDKNTLLTPTNIYGESKLKAEKAIQKLSTKNFKVVVLRPPMIYGKGCKGNYQTLRKIAIKLPIFPRVKNSRSLVYIENFSEFLKQSIDKELVGIYHPTNIEPVVTFKMVKEIAKNHSRKVLCIPFLSPFLILLSPVIPQINKAFGGFEYSREITSVDAIDYQICSFEESIKETET